MDTAHMKFAFPGGEATVSAESPQVSTRIDPAALPYRVCHGYMETGTLYCRTWVDALDVARILQAHYRANPDRRGSVSIQDIRTFDGDKRGGLTEEQYLEWVD